MTAALKGAIRNFGLTAALALGALLSAPSSASAQYQLTFGTANDGKSIGGTYVGNPSGDGETSTADVTITSGWASEFGLTTFTSSGNLGSGCATGLCFTKVNVPSPGSATTGSGEAVDTKPGTGHGGVGEFTFTPVGSNQTGLVSFVLGNENDAITPALVRIYALDGTTLLAHYSNAGLAKKGNDFVDVATDAGFLFDGGHTSADLLSGFKFEWGLNATADDGGDKIWVDNLIFKSEIAPEPNTMLLLGTGLLGLAPLARRRRKKA